MASNVSDESGELSLKSKIEAQRKKLEEIMDSESGLLGQLLSCGALSNAEKQEIQATVTTSGKNRLLVALILKNGKHHEFISALGESGQNHVVNWIIANGVYRIAEFHLDWPLTDEENEILTSNYARLSEMLDTEGILNLLYSKHVISGRQKESIESKKTSYDRAEAFLDTLSQFSLKSYDTVVDCLRESQQSHVADILENSKDGMRSIVQKIKAQMEELSLIIRPQFGLLATLRSLRALTAAEKDEIEALSTTDSQNKRLLDFVMKNKKRNELLDALNTTGQKHVANWIIGNGVYKDEFQLDWPLTDRETNILDTHYDFLSENIDTSHGLLTLMYSTSIINKRQMEYLDAIVDSSERAEALLDILRYCSRNSYNLAKICFQKSNQYHIAQILENGTVVVPVHANLEGQYIGVQEEALVREMERLILQSNVLSETDLIRILSKLRLTIIAATQGN